ncbi:hypothetical protein F0L74_18330 [Chitinophaga agrisoli]|uniref:DUF4142 domain-containing protein n=1 Tax=Chitinophaga agrisoli TaxID=2607653 RepID=A0A5B2VU32_9BACT|nr:hypothetical protein [Chitinophaga agrisoli]KAA2241822.1 hypothetical protein F0L74_18330 [Chitinophaga agrisoli]
MNKRLFMLLTMGVTLFHHLTIAQGVSSSVMRALIDSALKNNADKKIAIKHMKAAEKLFQLSKTSYVPDVLAAAGANTLEDMDDAMNSATADLVVKSTAYTNAYTCLHSAKGHKNIPGCITCTVANEYAYLLLLDMELITAQHNMLAADSILAEMAQMDESQVSGDAVSRVISQRLVAGYMLPAIEKHICWQEDGLSILAGVETGNIPRDSNIELRDVRPENCDI